MSSLPRITSPTGSEFDQLSTRLEAHAADLEQPQAWPQQQLEWCGQAGVYEWFHGRDWHGQQWDSSQIIEGYLRLSAACLTTTFVLTQRTGACQRIERSENEPLKEVWLPRLVSGEAFATVGISHLTTSRQHVDPVLKAEPTSEGFVLDGFSPWVTGVTFADLVVTGATLADGRQILVALPTAWEGVRIPETPQLVGLTASRTGQLVCEQVFVPRSHVLYGPVQQVMQQGAGGNTGGLQTSTLALGLARAAIDYLQEAAEVRDPLATPAEALESQWRTAYEHLMGLARGQTPCTNEELRGLANRLVLRATQSALMAAKGTGYVAGHPTGRWCREALFFLVWSCPQGVAQAHLCELAGLGSTSSTG